MGEGSRVLSCLIWMRALSRVEGEARRRVVILMTMPRVCACNLRLSLVFNVNRVWWSFRGSEVESVVKCSLVKGEGKPPKCCFSTSVSIFCPAVIMFRR